MSGLMASRGKVKGLLLVDGARKGFVADSLTVWAQALQKDNRSVRRYAQAGLLPGAYQTPGGQWRCPFTAQALQTVRQRLIGHARDRQRLTTTDATNLLPWSKADEKRAARLSIVLALYLGIKRERLRSEVQLTDFYQAVAFGALQPKEVDQDVWTAALKVTRKLGVRQTALVAACLHVVNEIEAESKAERIELFLAGTSQPFGHKAKGAAVINKKQSPRQGTTNSTIQYWQWLMGQRPVKNAKPVLRSAPNRPRDYIHAQMKHLSRRTFFNWYPENQRRRALRWVKDMM